MWEWERGEGIQIIGVSKIKLNLIESRIFFIFINDLILS